MAEQSCDIPSIKSLELEGDSDDDFLPKNRANNNDNLEYTQKDSPLTQNDIPFNNGRVFYDANIAIIEESSISMYSSLLSKNSGICEEVEKQDLRWNSQ